MAFAASIILLLFYFMHPQDWVPGMAGYNIVKPVIALAVLGLVTRRSDVPRWRLFRSPPEVAMLLFGAYVVYASAEPFAAFLDVGSLVCMGVLITQTLTTGRLLERYLTWWMIALIGVLWLALLTLAGLDVTGALPLIEIMGGRFCLNTWTLNNPNAFGHTMVTLLPLAYFILFYKRSFMSRLVAVIVMVLTVCALVPTESKGVFLAGAVGFTASMIFGRNLTVQITMALLAFGTMGSVLAMLPRMEGMKNLRADEGVVGRLMAWEQALAVASANPTGQGYKTFFAVIPTGNEVMIKATHSSFVKIGADLGRWGMIFYAGMLVVGLRTLMQYEGKSEPMERSRRILFALIVIFCISGWMIDRAYHGELFFFLGAIGAYHHLSIQNRTARAVEGLVDEDVETPPGAAADVLPSPWLPRPIEFLSQPEGAPGAAAMTMPGGGPEVITIREFSHSTAGASPAAQRQRLWTRIGLLDVLLAWVGAQTIFWIWDYLLRSV
jgi:hypothetical protein